VLCRREPWKLPQFFTRRRTLASSLSSKDWRFCPFRTTSPSFSKKISCGAGEAFIITDLHIRTVWNIGPYYSAFFRE